MQNLYNNPNTSTNTNTNCSKYFISFALLCLLWRCCYTDQLRIIEMKKHTSTCIHTHSYIHIENVIWWNYAICTFDCCYYCRFFRCYSESFPSMKNNSEAKPQLTTKSKSQQIRPNPEQNCIKLLWMKNSRHISSSNFFFCFLIRTEMACYFDAFMLPSW